MPTTKEEKDTTVQLRQESGQCVGCGSSDYTKVCYRGTPRYGTEGLYCESCFQTADEF